MRRSCASIPAIARSSRCTTCSTCRCRGGGSAAHPDRDGQVTPALRPARNARERDRRARRGPGTSPRRAGRMTVDARFERELPAILEDLYLGPAPDYRTDVLATAVRVRQRPSWTFPGRWLP